MGCLEIVRGCWALWDPIFFRHRNDWEVGEVERLFLRLGSKKLFAELDDKP